MTGIKDCLGGQKLDEALSQVQTKNTCIHSTCIRKGGHQQAVDVGPTKGDGLRTLVDDGEKRTLSVMTPLILFHIFVSLFSTLVGSRGDAVPSM